MAPTKRSKVSPPGKRPIARAPEGIDPQLAHIDRQLVQLLDQRARLVQQGIGSTTNASADEAGSPSQETSPAAVGTHALWQSQATAAEAVDALPPDTILSRSVVEEWLKHGTSACHAAAYVDHRVAYLGPIYSYSYLAAVKHFGQATNLVPVATISAVFEEIARKQASFGVVPVENSTDGRVVDTLGMFAKMPVHICGEVLLPIHHCLLGRCSRAEITEVHSKPQALSQCRAWLSQHLPDARLVEVASTATAARTAAEKKGTAAIASAEAGVHHGLHVIDGNIEDNSNNITRFVILSQQAAEPTGNDKTAIMFQVPHRPGALADAMLVFRKNKLNLTWIESFPIVESRSEYLFFVELEGHQENPPLREAIAKLRRQVLRLEVLGSYAKRLD